MNEHDPIRPNRVFSAIADAPTLEHRPRTLHLDVEKFQHHLDNCGLSDQEKAEYLHTIWSIVLEFIDLGYGVHPVQEFCGQDQETAGSHASQSNAVVDSSHQGKPKTNKPDADQDAGESEGT